MSPRIVGPSGVALDVSPAMARGLVRDGYAKLAEGEPESSLKSQAPAAIVSSEASPATVLPVGNSVPATLPDPDGGADGRPRGNASRDEWVSFALANGKTDDDLQGLKQGEIRALFAAPTEAPAIEGAGSNPDGADSDSKDGQLAQGSTPDSE